MDTCNRCHRPLKNPQYFEGKSYGPVCIAKVTATLNNAVFGGLMEEAKLHAEFGADPHYIGVIDHITGEREVIVDEDLLPLRLDLVNKSPTGFSWGYGGSGPAQLAIAILAHALDDGMAMDRYQDFLQAYIAKLDQDQNFEITKLQVMDILNKALVAH